MGKSLGEIGEKAGKGSLTLLYNPLWYLGHIVGLVVHQGGLWEGDMASAAKQALGAHTWVSVPAAPSLCRGHWAGCLVLQDQGPLHSYAKHMSQTSVTKIVIRRAGICEAFYRWSRMQAKKKKQLS